MTKHLIIAGGYISCPLKKICKNVAVFLNFVLKCRPVCTIILDGNLCNLSQFYYQNKGVHGHELSQQEDCGGH